MNQHPFAASDALVHECHAGIEMLDLRWIKIRRRQVKELDPSAFENRLVVAIFLAQIDDGADAETVGELGRKVGREAAANRQLLRQPMKIKPAVVAHIIFFFNIPIIFFFIVCAPPRLLLFRD
jgi:hypothetical protein